MIFPQVSERHRAPVLAIMAGTVISIAAMLGLGFGYDPVTAFAMIATALVIPLVGIYLVMNVACIGYFLRKSGLQPALAPGHPGPRDTRLHPGMADGGGIKAPGLSFITPLSAPLSYMGPAVAIWMVIGVIYLVFLYVRDRQRVTDVAMIHLDEEPIVAPDPRVAS